MVDTQLPQYNVIRTPTGLVGIQILCSDASPERAPKRVKLGQGHPGAATNHYEVSSGTKQEIHWKKAIGNFLAKHVLRPMGDKVDPTLCCLVDFPVGYQLYTHKKGDNYDWRTDCYLYGSSKVLQFRSPAEFFFHAKWLAEGMRGACQCAYCDPSRTQGEISERYSNYTKNKRKADAMSAKEDDAEGKGKKGEPAGRRKRRKAEPPIMAKDYREANVVFGAQSSHGL